jgi:hypothetical protein
MKAQMSGTINLGVVTISHGRSTALTEIGLGFVWMIVENIIPIGVLSPDGPARSESLY